MSAIEHPAREVGQDDLDVVGREHVGRLGHEVHAAEDDELDGRSSATPAAIWLSLRRVARRSAWRTTSSCW
jgi:hypothetical protein